MKKKRTQEILPWNNGEIETMLKEVISHGTEIAKIDFKTEIDTSTNEQKADLLKDIIAIANTYDDDNYEDHGFIIYGVKAKTITGTTRTEPDTDKFQNHVEQILKTYISPMPYVYVLGFETTDNKKWGAIVIPPRNNKPYMFFKDLFCSDRSRSRKKGEWFVRRGATTNPGLPEDLTLITQKQVELLLDPLRESIRGLQLRVSKTEDQYNSALFKLVERAISSVSSKTEQQPQQSNDLQIDVSENIDIGKSLGMDISTRLKQKLHTPKNAIAEDLVSEARVLREYLDGDDTGLPWVPQLKNPEKNKKIITDIEEKTKELQLSIATILLKDNKGEYTDALLRTVKMLAKAIEVPSGVHFNNIGKDLRYYPLALILYTIFICGVAANRGSILKQVLEVPIKHHRESNTRIITDVYFLCYAARELFNDAHEEHWCEPIVQRIRQVISDNIGEMITEYEEPEYFFRGEFVLALTNIDKGINESQADSQVPLGGLYLYMHEARASIVKFVSENPEWFAKLYNNSLEKILDIFDNNAHKMAVPGCIEIGMHDLKTKEIYQESLKRKSKKQES